MNDFYLTLPSNTTSQNTTANFSVHLPQKLNLQGKWEVALVEIQYPYSWENISGKQNKPTIDNWIDVTFENNFLATVYVPPGYYGSIFELVAAIEYGKEQASESLENSLQEFPGEFGLISKHIEDIKSGFIFIFDQTLKRVSCKFWGEKVKHVELSSKLQYMLGFEHAEIYKERNRAKYIPDIRIGFYSLYLYCSLVEPQIVGNVTAPLLRSVHVKGNHGDIIEKLYNTPHYVPVVAKEIDRVEIDIKDDNNQSVPFQFGKTVVKLHFRRKRALL